MTYRLETEGAPPPSTTTTREPWDMAMETLRERFPGASDGVLFCVFKLQSNPDLKIPDFRDEAGLHGISLGGRALHSARVLLGIEVPRARRSPAKLRQTNVEVPTGDDVAQSLISAVQELQESATTESHRLRDAMRQAIEVLQRALDGRD